MRQTITGDGDLNILLRRKNKYIKEIPLPANDFLGGTLTIGKRLTVFFGRDQKQAYSLYHLGDHPIKVTHRLVKSKLLYGRDENINVFDIDPSMSLAFKNIWIEGNKLKMEFYNDGKTILNVQDIDINWEVHK